MGRFKLPFALLVVGTAAVFATSGHWPWRRFDVTAPAAPIAPALEVPAYRVAFDTLHSGETISELFSRHGIGLSEIAALAPALNPRRLRAGLVFRFREPGDDSLPSQITVRTSPDTRLHFKRGTAGWATEADTIAWTPQVVRVEGAIDASLYEALDQQIPDSELSGAERQRLAWDIADIYRWQVDFTRDLQPGDHFQVLLERLVSEEGEVRFGRVLAADLSLGGKSYSAFRWEHPDGSTAFYDAQANSLQRAFLRAPVEFRRISSQFTSARYHPILGITRRHEGTDYAANAGTPVMAAGDGVVLRAGRAGGYGNLIELRHRSGITTRYGHLRAFAHGIHPGVHVKQGEVIGYVGMTGLATGPHLHYEFRINGVARDPRRINLGNGAPLLGTERGEFLAREQELATQLYPADGPVLAQRGN